MPPTATEEFLRRTPLRRILNIPSAFLDQAMATAYQLYRASRFAQAEILCKGLLAADPNYVWVHSLHAAVLHKLGRFDEALEQVEAGLRVEPAQCKLVALKREILAARQTINEHVAAGARNQATAGAPGGAPGPSPMEVR